MKKIILLLIGIVLAASCKDDEKNSYPPTFQGFRYEPTAVYAGDSVTIWAVQQKKGHYLNATDYDWSLTVKVDNNGTSEDLTLTHSHHTNYGGRDDSDPVWGLRLPANTLPGQYSCTFKARWSNSADGTGGTFNAGTGAGCKGTINSFSYTLYSEARGSFTLPVQRRQ